MAETNQNTPTSGNEEPTFYNVMPRGKRDAQVFSTPVVKTSSSTPSDTPDLAPDKSAFAVPWSGRRIGMIVGLGIAILVLVAFGYLGYRYAKQRQNTAKPNNNENVEPANNSNTDQQPSGVTTPPEWQQRYFSSATCSDINVCGDTADPDRDGLNNLDEYNTKTDPNNNDSDGDGLADGDEAHIFGSSPLTQRTNSSVEYTDADFAKGGYDVNTNEKFTDDKLSEIKTKIKDKGLHQPTIKTLGADALKQYDFTDVATTNDNSDSSSIDSSIDQSPSAKLARDTRRSDTIKKVGGALLKYKDANHGTFPDATDFPSMVQKIKPYLSIATNFDDPINKDKYVYGYVSTDNNQDFTLMYYSETQNLLIKYTAQQAQLDQVKDNASANDNIRLHDIQNIATALGIYSDAHTSANGTNEKVFPPQDSWKQELINGHFISQIPTDPRTGQDYDYQVGDHFDTFTLKATYDNPPRGQTGYMCNQIECKNY
jgi:hypothetical protein